MITPNFTELLRYSLAKLAFTSKLIFFLLLEKFTATIVLKNFVFLFVWCRILLFKVEIQQELEGEENPFMGIFILV